MPTPPRNHSQQKFLDASYERQLNELLKKQQANVRRAFLMSIQGIKDRVVLARVIEALRAGDVDAAIDALNIEPAAYWRFADAIRNTYTEAGRFVTSSQVWRFPDMSKATVIWDVDNPRARDWILNVSSQKITNEVELTKQVARETIEIGYALGKGPRDIALDVAGRIDTSGRRKGGVIGLNMPQERWATNARAELQDLDSHYFTRTARDKRFDKTIRKAIEEGKPLTKSQIDKIVNRYEDRLLNKRGEAVSRTETASAVNSARMESFKQAQEKTGIPDNAYVKIWSHGGPSRVGPDRVQHVFMNKKEVRGLDTPFVMPDGTLMQHPMDSTAPAGHLVNCRCTFVIEIDYKMLAV